MTFLVCSSHLTALKVSLSAQSTVLESVKDTSLTGSIPRMSNSGSVPANSVLLACLNRAVSVLTLVAHCCCLCSWLKEALQDGFIVHKDVSRSV